MKKKVGVLVGNTKMGETGLLLTLSRHTGIQGHSVLITSIKSQDCIDKIGAKSCEALDDPTHLSELFDKQSEEKSKWKDCRSHKVLHRVLS